MQMFAKEFAALKRQKQRRETIPLPFSGGLVQSLESVNQIAAQLINACKMIVRPLCPHL